MSSMTEDWVTMYDEESGLYFVAVVTSYHRNNVPKEWRPHTNGIKFEEPDMCDAWINAMEERWTQQEEDYLEENRHAIMQMERYDRHRMEY